ncbi:hypothetical protein [Myxococcus landrumensis]|uniref:Ig-like domain-containing protein n=1 Tax=Myxococcus landrumensis TaxID=2813577 RepID=A0ABX7MZR6_9BACT|nr:hypothetical protein [Myxococcus landrumus]QSQ11940.1 hypothetical protein JY572_26575 [Myxococcus landrumus]
MPVRPVLVLVSVLVLVLLTVGTRPVFAQEAPRTMAFQGRLVRADGSPEGSPQDITFALYATATGGAPLWQESHVGVPVTNGYYAVVLGASVPLRDDVMKRNELHLGVTLAGQSELIPRLPLTSVPFALRANDSQRLAGSLPSAFAPALHSHNAASPTAQGFMSAGDKDKLDDIPGKFGDGLIITTVGTQPTLSARLSPTGGTNGTSVTVARADHQHTAPKLSCTYPKSAPSSDPSGAVAWCIPGELLMGGGCEGIHDANASPGATFMPMGVSTTTSPTQQPPNAAGYRCQGTPNGAAPTTAYAICCQLK